jgi:DNA-binding transcriptional LysR family regulator
MQFRQLRHFVTVAEELHMHRAAERLNIAQPALSQQIKSLEERLGVVLFSRAHRRLALTPAGEAFLEKTRMALEMADGAVLDARRTARGELGELNLGYVSSAMFNPRLPRLLRQLQTRGAQIQVSLSTGNVQSLLDDVTGYRIDIAVIRGPVAVAPEELVVRFTTPRREVQRQPVAVAGYPQVADEAGGEDDLGCRVVQVLKNHLRAGQRRVTTKINFVLRGEPAQLKPRVGADKKRGLGLIMLLCHLQENVIREPGFQRTNGSGVTAKGAIAERIDQVKFNFFHWVNPFY